MTVPIQRPASAEGMFLWVMHRFAEVFDQHAVIKGGMALRLYDCPRSTTDIDYVFVPFESKREIVGRIEAVLAELEGARVDVSLHSTMLRATIELDAARIQVEASVAGYELRVPHVPLIAARHPASNGEGSRSRSGGVGTS